VRFSNAKRLYTDVACVQTEHGWSIHLDGRALKTPAKAPFVAPKAVAEAAASEWRSQKERIDPLSMPVTRAVHTAIERIAPQRDAVIDEIAAFGATDLICYRAESPQALIAREQEAWDPLLDWARGALNAELLCTNGVCHQRQPQKSLDMLRTHIVREPDLGLSALFDLTTLSGSLIIALAVAYQRLSPDEAWRRACIDETYQSELWGEDPEAMAKAEEKRRAFRDAAFLYDILRDGDRNKQGTAQNP
jgi:chaperone required for assembly of F1-ATPase